MKIRLSLESPSLARALERTRQESGYPMKDHPTSRHRTRRSLTGIVILVGAGLVIAAPLLSGCGGGSSSSAAGLPAAPDRSRITVSFQWPDLTASEGRAIPRLARFLRVQILQQDLQKDAAGNVTYSVIQTQVRERPDSRVASSETLEFNDVPTIPGQIKIRAEAWSGVPDSSTKMASFPDVYLVDEDKDGKFEPISISLNSTVAALKLDSPDLTVIEGKPQLELRVGESKIVNVVAYDAIDSDGNPTGSIILLDPDSPELTFNNANASGSFDVVRTPGTSSYTIKGLQTKANAPLVFNHNGGANNVPQPLNVTVRTAIAFGEKSGSETLPVDTTLLTNRQAGNPITLNMTAQDGLSSLIKVKFTVKKIKGGILTSDGIIKPNFLDIQGGIKDENGNLSDPSEYSLSKTTLEINPSSSHNEIIFTPRKASADYALIAEETDLSGNSLTGTKRTLIVQTGAAKGVSVDLSTPLPGAGTLDNPYRINQGNQVTLTARENGVVTTGATFQIVDEDGKPITSGTVGGSLGIDSGLFTSDFDLGTTDRKLRIKVTTKNGGTGDLYIQVTKFSAVIIGPAALTAQQRTGTYSLNVTGVSPDQYTVTWIENPSPAIGQPSGGNYVIAVPLKSSQPRANVKLTATLTFTAKAPVKAPNPYTTGEFSINLATGNVTGTIQ